MAIIATCNFGGQIARGQKCKIVCTMRIAEQDEFFPQIPWKAQTKSNMRRSFAACTMLQTRKHALGNTGSLPTRLWSMSRWHIPLAWSGVPHIYVYLIDTLGEFTREKLKTFKRLEACNYYIRYCNVIKLKMLLVLQYLFLFFFNSLVAGFIQFIFATLVIRPNLPHLRG